MAEREEIDLFTVEPINPFLASAFLKTHLYSCNALGVLWGLLRSPVHIKHPEKQNSKKPERSSYGKTPLLIFP